jgi:hypothetical protein
MVVTRCSGVSGKVHTLEIPVTSPQIARWEAGMNIAQAMPDLTLTGTTAEEWAEILPPEEEES